MIAKQQIVERVGHSAVDEHQHPANCCIAISIHFPMLFQRFRRRCSRSQDLARAVTNTPAICSPSVFLHFPLFFKGFRACSVRSRDLARGAAGRTPGTRRVPSRTYCFCKVFQWAPWVPRPIPGRGGGAPRRGAVCSPSVFLHFPIVFQCFRA